MDMLPMNRLTDELIKVTNYRKKRMNEIEKIDRLFFRGFRKSASPVELRNGMEILGISYLERVYH